MKRNKRPQQVVRQIMAIALLATTTISCDPSQNQVISDFADNSRPTDIYVFQGNELFGLRDNRVTNQDFNRVNKIEPILNIGIPSNTVSTPLVIRERARDNDPFDFFLCLATADGTVSKYSIPLGDPIWSYTMSAEVSASVTSSFYENYSDDLFVGDHNGKFVCLRSMDGSVKWSFNTPSGAGIQGAANCSFVNRSTNIRYVVFGGDDGYLYCLNAQTGFNIWKFYTGASITSTPRIYNESLDSDFIVAVGNHAGDFFALDITDGSQIWHTKLPDIILSSADIAYNNDGSGKAKTLFIGCNDQNLYALNPIDGTILWQYATQGAVVSSPYHDNDNRDRTEQLFFGSNDGFMYSLNGATGALNWKKDMQAGAIRSSPVFVNDAPFVDALYVSTTNGVFSLDATTGDIQTQFLNPNEGNNLSSPMINYLETPVYPSLIR